MNHFDRLIGLNYEDVQTRCLDIDDKVITRVTDEQAKTLIKKIAKYDNALDFQSLDIKTRDKYLKKLRDKGLSIRQPSRLTGVSYSVVRKFWQHIDPSPVLCLLCFFRAS